MWSVRSISADPGTSEANYVSGSCEGRYEESDHGKRIRNISDGTYDLKYLCKTIHRTGGLLYLAVCDRITYRADHLFYGEICIQIADAKGIRKLLYRICWNCRCISHGTCL